LLLEQILESGRVLFHRFCAERKSPRPPPPLPPPPPPPPPPPLPSSSSSSAPNLPEALIKLHFRLACHSMNNLKVNSPNFLKKNKSFFFFITFIFNSKKKEAQQNTTTDKNETKRRKAIDAHRTVTLLPGFIETDLELCQGQRPIETPMSTNRFDR